MSQSHYRVDSFHVNIEAGDAAIHILSSGPGTTKKRVVQRAIFIDGGTSHNHRPRQNVFTTIAFIEYVFQCQGELNTNGLPSLIFDAFIVTHWDADHFEGVLEYLKADIQFKVDSDGWDPAKTPLGLSRAWYTKDATTERLTPRSWFYAPYWIDDSIRSKLRSLNDNFDIGGNDGNGNGTMTIKVVQTSTKKPFSAPEILKIRTGTERLLGRNFFDMTMDGSWKTEWSNMANVEGLLKKNRPSDPASHLQYEHVPGMYCVAVNGQALGYEPKATITDTNKSSIGIMVVWSNGTCGHYFAGDAESDLEVKLVHWAGRNRLVNGRVASVKLSHHGARTSNPPEMFRGFDPLNMIVSAGSSHGHPRWELLVMIDAWLKTLPGGGGGKRLLFPTQYPSYLFRVVRNGDTWKYAAGSWSIAEAKTNSQTAISVAQLEDEFAKDRGQSQPVKGFFSSYEDWAKANPKNDEDDRKQWICEQLDKATKSILRLQHQDEVAGRDVLCVYVKSTADKGFDGRPIIYFVNFNQQGQPESFAYKSGIEPADLAAKMRTHMMPSGRMLALGAANVDNPGAIAVRRFGIQPKDPPGRRDFSGWAVGSHGAQGATEASPRRRSWVDLGDQQERRTSTDSSSSFEELLGVDEIGFGAASHTYGELASRPPPVIRRRNIPTHIALLAPAVYVASELAIEDVAFPKQPKAVPILQSHPAFGFVESLHWRAFSLATAVVARQASKFAPDDAWLAWFRLFFTWEGGDPALSDCELSMTPTAWPLEGPDTNAPLGFSTSFSLLGGQQKLTMSTTAAATETFKSVVTGDVDAALQKMLTWRFAMVFGLEPPPEPVVITLGALCKLVGHDGTTMPALKFPGLETMSLTLDTGPEARNALWFSPNAAYETVLRLQFRADASKLNEWIALVLPGFEIQDAFVIVRKQGTYQFRRKSDFIDPEGSLMFVFTTVLKEVRLAGVMNVQQGSIALTLTHIKPAAGPTHMGGPDAHANAAGVLDALLEWMDEKLQLGNIKSVTQLLETAQGGGAVDKDSVYARRAEVILDLGEDGKISGIRSASISLEVCLTIGKTEDQTAEPLLFLLVFGWSEFAGVYLRGSVWCQPPQSQFGVYEKALPEWEPHLLLEPITEPSKDNPLRTIDIRRLISGGSADNVSSVPTSLPTEVYRAVVEISQKGISFSGALRCPAVKDPAGSKKPPSLVLDTLELAAGYQWTGPGKGLSLRLAVDVLLYKNGRNDADLPTEQQVPPARLRGAVEYGQSAWRLTASVQGLTVAHLASFWHAEDRADVLEFMGKVGIDYASVEYAYDAADSKGLTVKGVLALGETLKLGLRYANRGRTDWAFDASLAAGSKLHPGVYTVRTVLEGFLDREKLEGLPGAVLDAQLGAPGSGKEPFKVICARHETMTVFAVLITIEPISLLFVQFRQDGRPVKRLVKAKLGAVTVNTALFGTLKSPFEQMFFLWAQDTQKPPPGAAVSAAGTAAGALFDGSATAGISHGELKLLQGCLVGREILAPDDFLLFKPTKEMTAYTDAEIVVTAGSHFVVVAKNTDGKAAVVLDYPFQKQNKQQKPKQTSRKLLGYAASEGKEGGWWDDDADDDWDDSSYDGYYQHPAWRDGAVAAAVDDAPSPTEKGSKAAYKRTLGPLSVDNIGLWYDQERGVLGISLDATFLMGPFGLSLLGFGIGVPFGQGFGLSNPPGIGDMSWTLDGLVVALDRPPLTVAGGFMRQKMEAAAENDKKAAARYLYAGGLIVGFKPWMFEAMGVYANIPRAALKAGPPTTSSSGSITECGVEDGMEEMADEEDTFTFSFIICRLNGPLFSVGWADFSGLVGGFGINSDITLPTVEQVVDFPFVRERGADASEPPVTAMTRLLQGGTWFRPAEGLFWAAAGVRITAFQMVAVNAVLVAQFGQDDLALGLFGVATVDVPALDAPFKFAHVELGIVATLDVGRGVLKIEAQLSPRSYVLAPACHLTGGLAMYAWFKDDDGGARAGDWVLTLGGYHPAFRAPTQYPRPPRLGISWSLDASLSVTGEAYFAVTPRVCMGGARLHAALSLGALYAWFDAFVDFLMNFDPFYFQLQASLAVGVRFTLDLWIVTIRINAEVGATLDLSGPPFGGVVHVNFWVFGFDVKFGSPPPLPKPASLARFWAVVIKAGAKGGALSFPANIPTANLLQQQQQPAVSRHSRGSAHEEADSTAMTPIVLTCESGLEPQPGTGTQKTDKDTEWLVRSGTFSFLVTFQFAECKKQKFEIGKRHQDIYARPMQLQSTLHFKADVVIESPLHSSSGEFHILDNWEKEEWCVTSVVKPVQSSIWGQYDPALDPIQNPRGGTSDSSLLDGTKGDGTLPLVMGLSVAPPKPSLADDKVNQFNVVADRRQPVARPHFPNAERTKADKAWLPEGKRVNWTEVRDEWRAATEGGRVGDVVRRWGERLGFESGSVVGVQPTCLLDKFEGLVPAVPLVAVGTREVR